MYLCNANEKRNSDEDDETNTDSLIPDNNNVIRLIVGRRQYASP